MQEVCAIGRNESGVHILIDAKTTAAARRFLIDATYAVRSLEDIDAQAAPPTTEDALGTAGAIDPSDSPAAAATDTVAATATVTASDPPPAGHPAAEE